MMGVTHLVTVPGLIGQRLFWSIPCKRGSYYTPFGISFLSLVLLQSFKIGTASRQMGWPLAFYLGFFWVRLRISL